MALALHWMKCGTDWCDFQTVNLSHEHLDDFSGVYLIWCKGDPRKVVRIGQGSIRDRLKADRKELDILDHAAGGLYATWARVDESLQDGVEDFLSDHYNPIVGERFPGVTPVPVNLPF